ncbi:MAG TPA: carboxypeptidase-like regulatory domain-containing protein, partial [Bacteroidales bacterium]|nr:carboxypeptidase-like regulatory domain-containing protein [Bacteroidales bacterium]
MKSIITLLFLIIFIVQSNAQTITQTIRGTIVETNSEEPVIGASVVVLNSNPLMGTTSNEKGNFRLEKIPVGRHTLQISFIGFKTVTIPAIELVSGKETVLKITMEENII